MNLEKRIQNLEHAASRLDPMRPTQFPETWLERMPDGSLRGPIENELVAPGQLLLFCQVATMEARGPIAQQERDAILRTVKAIEAKLTKA